MNYLIGLDLGTSGVKCVLLSEKGELTASAVRGYPLYQPRNGWAEQDPEDWYRAAAAAIREVMESSGIDPGSVAGLSLAGQMHGPVLLDRSGRVLRRAILWCDARGGAQCRQLTERVGERRLIGITANPALPGFTAAKLLWLRDNENAVFRRCSLVLLPKDYVRYRLTGTPAQEISDASGTNLLDVTRRAWSGEILRALEIDPMILPPLIEAAAPAGTVNARSAELTGLRRGTPVAAGAGDNAAAAVGTGVCRDGEAFATLGTSGVIYAHTSKPVIDPLGRVHTFCAAIPGAWCALSCTLAAGLSLSWAGGVLYPRGQEDADGGGVYGLMLSEAAAVAPGADGLIYLPYLMGERSPVLDPEARGVFFGLSARHTRAHLTRAVIEGVSLSQKHNLAVLSEMGLRPGTLTVTGGALAFPAMRQLLADVLNTGVRSAPEADAPALGAAVLAGTAAGIFGSAAEGAALCRKEGGGVCRPEPAAAAAYEKIYAVYASLYPALRPAFARLSSLRAELEGRPVPRPAVTSVEFERYGRVIEGVDIKRVLELLERTPLPSEGVAYVPSEPALETPELLADIQERVFGGLKVQIGYCSGTNHTLNALEYHRCSELNIAQKDALLLVAPLTAARGGVVDTRSVEIFTVKAGTAVLFYETTLHYAPCCAPGEEYFRMCCVLPRGTNTARPAGVTREGEAGLLTHNNKWLFAHADSPEGAAGVTSGRLIGANLTTEP